MPWSANESRLLAIELQNDTEKSLKGRLKYMGTAITPIRDRRRARKSVHAGRLVKKRKRLPQAAKARTTGNGRTSTDGRKSFSGIKWLAG